VALQRLGGTRVAISDCPDTDSLSARCQNRGEYSPLAINTAAFGLVLVMFVADFGSFMSCLLFVSELGRNCPVPLPVAIYKRWEKSPDGKTTKWRN